LQLGWLDPIHHIKKERVQQCRMKTYRICNSDKDWISPDSEPFNPMLANVLQLRIIGLILKTEEGKICKPQSNIASGLHGSHTWVGAQNAFPPTSAGISAHPSRWYIFPDILESFQCSNCIRISQRYYKTKTNN